MFIGNMLGDFCKRLFYLFGTLFVAWFVYWIVCRLRDKARVKTIIKKKQQEREDEFLKLELQFNSEQDYSKIYELSDEQLIDQLQKRKLKATEVLEAFLSRAIRINRDLNCVTEFISQAQEWAAKLDQGPIKGPLHGLPVSIKDNCNVQGMDSTLGLGKRLYKPAEDHAVIVKVLLDLGAVPFAKTNVPQTLLSFDCCNPVFGTTLNHLNSQLSPGGSSGGEASLIGAGGSLIGIGSDIGGSVRIPAHFSGVVGFKSTKDRISPVGFEASLPNVVGIVGVPGLMAKNTKTLKKIYQLILDERRQQKYDSLTLPIGFDEKVFSAPSKLKIGYFTNLPFYPLIGDTEAVVLEAKRALEHQGHTLIPFEMPDSTEMFKLITDFGFADSGAHFLKSWKHEPVPRGLLGNYLVCRLPRFLRHTVAFLIDVILPYFHSSRAALIMRGGARTTTELWTKLGARKKMLDQLLSQWRSLNLDLVLCPTMPFPAVPHNYPGRLQSSVVYTMSWNMFDFPCGCVPFGRESGEKIDSYNDQGDFMLRVGKKGSQQAVGMPISVQLVGLPYEDEKVIRGMQILESLAPSSSKKLQ